MTDDDAPRSGVEDEGELERRDGRGRMPEPTRRELEQERLRSGGRVRIGYYDDDDDD